MQVISVTHWDSLCSELLLATVELATTSSGRVEKAKMKANASAFMPSSDFVNFNHLAGQKPGQQKLFRARTPVYDWVMKEADSKIYGTSN